MTLLPEKFRRREARWWRVYTATVKGLFSNPNTFWTPHSVDARAADMADIAMARDAQQAEEVK